MNLEFSKATCSISSFKVSTVFFHILIVTRLSKFAFRSLQLIFDSGNWHYLHFLLSCPSIPIRFRSQKNYQKILNQFPHQQFFSCRTSFENIFCASSKTLWVESAKKCKEIYFFLKIKPAFRQNYLLQFMQRLFCTSKLLLGLQTSNLFSSKPNFIGSILSIILCS